MNFGIPIKFKASKELVRFICIKYRKQVFVLLLFTK